MLGMIFSWMVRLFFFAHDRHSRNVTSNPKELGVLKALIYIVVVKRDNLTNDPRDLSQSHFGL